MQDDLVSQYLQDCDQHDDSRDSCCMRGACCADEFPPMGTIEDAIRIAALSVRKNGKIHSHQCSIRKGGRELLAQLLRRCAGDIAACKNFDKLYDTIWLHKCKGVGELFAYDVALRIAEGFLGISPDKVYLHAGSAKGAKKLIKKDMLKRRVDPMAFPEAIWRRLSCPQIEDFLCIFCDSLPVRAS